MKSMTKYLHMNYIISNIHETIIKKLNLFCIILYIGYNQYKTVEKAYVYYLFS